MNARRIAYPALAPGLVESVNALASAVDLRLDGVDDAGQWRVRPSVPGSAYHRRATLGVRIGGSAQRVHLDAGGVEVAVADLAGEIDFETLDRDLQAAVLETTLAGPLRALGAVLGAQVVLEGIAPATRGDEPLSDRDPAALRFEVHSPSDAVVCSVLLEVTTPLPPGVIDALAGFARPRDAGDLAVVVAFEAGSAELTRAELGSLAVGDIVLFEPHDADDAAVRVNVGGQVWRTAELGEEGVALAVRAPVGERDDETAESAEPAH